MTTLREQRLAASLSLRQLAAATGVHSAYLSQIETGRRAPRADELLRIGEALGIDPSRFEFYIGIRIEEI